MTAPPAKKFIYVAAWFALTCGGGTLASSSLPARAAAAEFTMKIAVPSADDCTTRYSEAVGAAVQKASNGRIDYKVYTRHQLGAPAATIQGLQLGTIEAYATPADFYIGVDPRMGVFSIPFLFKNVPHANQVLGRPDLNKEILALLESKGIVGAAIVAVADGLYISKKPITKIADFKGQKLRVNATDPERERMRRLGATPVPMGTTDMIPSLQSGVIDGTMSGMSIHVGFNLEVFSKQLLKTEDTLLVVFAGVSKAWLDRLPSELREIVLREARGLQGYYGKECVVDDKELAKKWTDRGGTIVTLPPEESAELRKTLDSIGDSVTAPKPDVQKFYHTLKAEAAR